MLKKFPSICLKLLVTFSLIMLINEVIAHGSKIMKNYNNKGVYNDRVHSLFGKTHSPTDWCIIYFLHFDKLSKDSTVS